MNSFINSYQELLKFYPMSFRNKLRHHYLNFAGSKKLEVAKLPKSSVLFLYFHSFFSDTHQGFKKILESIQEHYEFKSYSECVNILKDGKIDKRYACISSDDGFENFQDASLLFDSLGIKAMVFVNPLVIGNTDVQFIKSHCVNKLGSPPQKFLDWGQLEHLISRGHEIGNHGWSHKNLMECNSDELTEEIVKSKIELESRLGPIRHYAYPYGEQQFMSKEIMFNIIEAGHVSLASGIRGQHSKNINLLNQLIHREQVECFYPMKHAHYFIQKKR